MTNLEAGHVRFGSWSRQIWKVVTSDLEAGHVRFGRCGRALWRQAQVRSIVMQQIERVRGRLADRKIGLRVSEAAADAVADAGYDPAFGKGRACHPHCT